MITISGNQFHLDGQALPHPVGGHGTTSAPPAYWEDRLLKLRAMGLNTVETYVAWNLHEPRPGEFHFEGGLDLDVISRWQRDGLKVIVRPGPYICSECGPGRAALLAAGRAGMRLRCAYSPYLVAVDRFLGGPPAFAWLPYRLPQRGTGPA